MLPPASEPMQSLDALRASRQASAQSARSAERSGSQIIPIQELTMMVKWCTRYLAAARGPHLLGGGSVRRFRHVVGFELHGQLPLVQ